VRRLAYRGLAGRCADPVPRYSKSAWKEPASKKGHSALSATPGLGEQPGSKAIGMHLALSHYLLRGCAKGREYKKGAWNLHPCRLVSNVALFTFVWRNCSAAGLGIMRPLLCWSNSSVLRLYVECAEKSHALVTST